MSYQREREDFIRAMGREGMSADVARLILRHAQTYHRLSERECNGDDWQSGQLVKCPNRGKLITSSCPECGVGVGDMPAEHGKVTRSSVRMMQIERRIRELAECASTELRVEFSGDPRGCTVRILPVQTHYTAIGVPTRSR